MEEASLLRKYLKHQFHQMFFAQYGQSINLKLTSAASCLKDLWKTGCGRETSASRWIEKALLLAVTVFFFLHFYKATVTLSPYEGDEYTCIFGYAFRRLRFGQHWLEVVKLTSTDPSDSTSSHAFTKFFNFK